MGSILQGDVTGGSEAAAISLCLGQCKAQGVAAAHCVLPHVIADMLAHP